MTIQRFEDLIAWQKARDLSKRIFSITASGKLGQDPVLRNQMRRAALSIMSNLAEGFERGTNTEFHRFIHLAKGSCAELRSHLYASSDTSYISKDLFNELSDQAIEVGKLIGGLHNAVVKRIPAKKNKPTA